MLRFNRLGKDPRDQSDCQFANLVVEWYPERLNRILLCAHYDTLPYPMRDAVDPKGVFVGANDGASGVALLMVLGEELPSLNLPFGVDFVLFDAEEYRFGKDDPFAWVRPILHRPFEIRKIVNVERLRKRPILRRRRPP